jgi:FMN-dependent NADH-azoreductase
MSKLLLIDSSADLDTSVSRQLTQLFAETWATADPANTVVRRDLHRQPPPHLPHPALHWAPRLRSAQPTVDAGVESLQRELIDELVSADVVVIGAPMYNWSLPSTLKAWVDYVHVLGTTTPFDDESQPLAGKPAVIVSSRGDQYGPGTANPDADHAVPPLVLLLGEAFKMEVEVVTAELTLAETIPELNGFVADAQRSLASARESVVAAATRLAKS